ncbi:MAG TPA: hypothetical protein VGJ51_06120 [Candidatus Angelobacter sp.]
MRLHTKTTQFTLAAFLFGATFACFAQDQNANQPKPDASTQSNQPVKNAPVKNDSHCVVPGGNPGSPRDTQCVPAGTSVVIINDPSRRDMEEAAAYKAFLRARAIQEEAARTQQYDPEPKLHANPDASDPSVLLKNSKDHDYILRNFHTMYVDARDAQYFGSDQMKAALGNNKDFAKLNIHIVEDARVADTVLTIGYTFAWDYPFALRHQNTTMVLVSGKGEGPFSGPLGATDVARQFVNAVKAWREKAISK